MYTTEIASTRPIQASQSRQPLLVPLQNSGSSWSLPPGSRVEARVMQTLNSAQGLQVLLQITGTATPTLVRFGTTQALPVGTQLWLSRNASGVLQVHLQQLQPQTRINLLQRPPGSLLPVRVLQCTPLTQHNYELQVQSIEPLDSGTEYFLLHGSRPASPGDTLTLKVLSAEHMSVTTPQALQGNLGTQRHLREQLAHQEGFEPLLHALERLLARTATEPGAQSAQALLKLIPMASELLEPARLRQLVANSGIYLEPHLLQDKGVESDFKAALLQLIDELRHAAPDATKNQPAPTRAPYGDGSAQTGFPLLSHSAAEMDDLNAQGLLRQALSSLARLHCHQLACLPNPAQPEGLLQHWQVEIPYRQGQQYASVQARIEQRPARSKRKRLTCWHIELSLDLGNLGPLNVHADLTELHLESHFWTSNTATQALLNKELPGLRARLEKAGFEVSSLDCKQGDPPRPAAAPLERRWVDESV